MHRKAHFYTSLVVAAAVMAAIAFAGSASAATPAAVDEYVAQQAPSATDGSGTAGTQGSSNQQQVAGKNASSGNGSGAAGTEAVSGGSGGSLPFTGYPMAPIVWIFLALLGAGLGLRLGLAAYRALQRPGRPEPPKLHVVR